jgi:hypothetical protein
VDAVAVLMMAIAASGVVSLASLDLLRRERDFFIDNLLVIEMILVDQPCAMGV